MPLVSKTIRVFVSSTFSDLKAERNALQEHVFPRLRELCAAHGWRFQAIDLRWGVSEEAGLDQRTMRICLSEIARCQRVSPQPNFIILLGDRYGWRPLPEEIRADEFEALRDSGLLSAEECSLFEWREDQPPEARGWYRRDDNALYHRQDPVSGADTVYQGVYILQRRTGRFEDFATWEHEVERPLLAALQRAATALHLSPETMDKYGASATEQEIEAGAFAVHDAKEHVLAFFRTIREGGMGVPPMAHDRDGHDTQAGGAARLFTDLDESGGLDVDAQTRLQDLKRRIEQKIGHDNVANYEAQWTGDGVTQDHIGTPAAAASNSATPDNAARDGSLPDGAALPVELPPGLCRDVFDRLAAVIRAQMARLEAIGTLESDVELHEQFGEERRRFFTGRAAPLRAIADYLASDDRRPFAICGVSGAGKTALMARAYARTRHDRLQAHKVVWFVGATPQSSTPYGLLQSLCREIGEIYGFSQSDLPVDYPKLSGEFRRSLGLATDAMPLALFIDALDQFDPNAEGGSLGWLPRDLPEHVHIVVSVMAPGEHVQTEEPPHADTIPAPNATHPADRFAAYHNLRSIVPESNRYYLKSMAKEETETLLKAWLDNAGRTLQPAQREEVLAGAAKCPIPFWLKLAFEEARTWRSYDIPVFGPSGMPGLPQTVYGLVQLFFARLSHPANHGLLLVERALTYLCCARNGLTEEELLDLLACDEEYRTHLLEHIHHELPGVTQSAIPVVLWSRLHHDLESYLTERTADGTTLLSFYHRQVGEWVDQVLLRNASTRQARHCSLAHYFSKQQLPVKSREVQGRRGSRLNLRKLSELPWQQAHAGLGQKLLSTLTDFGFLHAKLRASGPRPLIAEYDLAQLPVSNMDPDSVTTLQVIQGAIRLAAHVVQRDPTQFASQLIARVAGFEQDPLRVLLESTRAWRGALWIMPTQPLCTLTPPGGPLLRTLEGQPGCCVYTDGRRALSYGDRLKLWDLETGDCLGTVEGRHTCAVFADERRALSDSTDISANWWDLRLWDLETGQCLLTLERHRWGRTCTVFDDGRRALSAGGSPVGTDNTLKLWSLEDGQCIKTLEGHSDTVLKCVVFADNLRALSMSSDKTLRLWNLRTGECLKTLRGHTDAVNWCAVFASGRRALSASTDETLKMWDLETGECLKTLEGHRNYVSLCTVLPDERRALSISGDCTLKLWDLEMARCLRTFEGHLRWLTACAVFADGHRALSASADSTLRLWDLDTGACLKTLEGHTDSVSSCAVFAHGRRALSASYDNTLRLWDLDADAPPGRTPERHAAAVRACAVFAEGRRVLSASSDNTLKVWDVDTGLCLRTLEGHCGRVTGCVVSTGGPRALSVSEDNTFKLWDLDTGECLSTLQGCNVVSMDCRHALSSSPPGGDYTLKLWDLDTGECLRILEGHSGAVNACAILANGCNAFSASSDETLKLWDLHTGDCLKTFEGGWLDIMVTVSSDKRALIARTGGIHPHCSNMLEQWDLETGECLKLRGHTDQVNACAVFARGGRMLSASSDKTLRVWDLDTGACLRTLEGHGQSVHSCAVLADERRAVSVSSDMTLKLWDLDTGTCLATFTSDELMLCCSISPDGILIVAGDGSGRVHFLRPIPPSATEGTADG